MDINIYDILDAYDKKFAEMNRRLIILQLEKETCEKKLAELKNLESEKTEE